VVVYIEFMTAVKIIEASKAIFMDIRTVEHLETGTAVNRIIETYYHTADDSWRVFSDGQVKEVYNVTAPVKNVGKLFLHYNTADVDLNIVYELSKIAKEIREVVRQYLVLDEKYYNIIASWIIATYTRWVAPYAELLIIRKLGVGADSSTLLKVVATLSARPLPPSAFMPFSAFYRIADFTMPTVTINESMNKIKLSELKRIAESAFDREYVVLRVVKKKAETFSTYANVAIVDITNEFTTYSARRKAWMVAIKPTYSQRFFDFDEMLSDTVSLREKLYSLGIVLPTLYYDQWEKIVGEQGLGVLRFLAKMSKILSGDASVFESALETVKRQFEYANQIAVLNDPKRMVTEILLRIINDAKRELEIAKNVQGSMMYTNVFNIVKPLDDTFRCGYVYLERLIREVRRKLTEMMQIEVDKLDDVYYGTEQLLPKINEAVKMYLKPTKIKTILAEHGTAEFGIMLEINKSRNYYIKICL